MPNNARRIELMAHLGSGCGAFKQLQTLPHCATDRVVWLVVVCRWSVWRDAPLKADTHPPRGSLSFFVTKGLEPSACNVQRKAVRNRNKMPSGPWAIGTKFSFPSTLCKGPPQQSSQLPLCQLTECGGACLNRRYACSHRNRAVCFWIHAKPAFESMDGIASS